MKAFRLLLLLSLMGIMVLPFGARRVSAQGAVSTAQSVMFQADLTGDFVVTSTQVWVYDRDAAETYFTNTWDGNAPTVSCTGQGCSGQPIPPAPPAPAPNPNRLNPVVGQNKCTFFAGGTLQGDTYTQTADIVLGSGQTRRAYRYTFTYVIAPTVNPVAARTAWVLQSSSSSAAQVMLGGFFAGQSTVRRLKPTGADWTFKTSHTMRKPDGTPRLVDPVATLYDPDGNMVGSPLPLSFTMESAVDYWYSKNAGHNGDANQLVDGGWVSAIQSGGVASPSPLNLVDDFSGNNAALGERAVIYPVQYLLSQPGEYRLNVAGTLKNVEGGVDVTFSIDANVDIDAESCSP